MSTLLLRLASPLQSWGVKSKYNWRYTEREPSKSGVIGLCAAALGYWREEEGKIKDLNNLRFGVRIDRPGKLIMDFHMVHEESFWNPDDRSKIDQDLSQDKKNKFSHLTKRYYLADAAFLVGLEGDENYLQEIGKAIRAPMFPLYLGRRSCPPEGQIFLGVVSENLEEAFQKQPPICEIKKPFETTIMIDASTDANSNKSLLVRDLPRSYNPEHRKYDFRQVSELDTTLMPKDLKPHDPLAAIEEV